VASAAIPINAVIAATPTTRMKSSLYFVATYTGGNAVSQEAIENQTTTASTLARRKSWLAQVP